MPSARRFLVLAAFLAAGLPAVQAQEAELLRFGGKLTGELAKDTVHRNSARAIHLVKLTRGKQYRIDVTSQDFDAAVRVEDTTGKEVASDNDSGGNRNARAQLIALHSTAHRIIVTSAEPGFGAYELRVTELGTIPGFQEAATISLVNGRAKVPSQLTESDEKDNLQTGAYRKVFVMQFVAGKDYRIDMVSEQLDPSLRLETMAGAVLASDEDGAGFPNARILFKAPNTGAFRLIALASGKPRVGPFVVQVEDPTAPPESKVALGLKLVLKNGMVEAQNSIAANANRDVKRNRPCTIHSITLQQGKTYQIDMTSPNFDSYLRLEDMQGQELAFDDDGGGYPSARIRFQCSATGTYRIIATSFSGGTGQYNLKVQQTGP